MVDAIWKVAEKLADRNYTVSVSEDRTTDGQPIYMAKTPELFGCMAQGKTLEEAIKSLKEARIEYIYDSLKDGVEVPAPSPLAVRTLDTAYTLEPDQFTVEIKQPSKDTLEDLAKTTPSKQLYEATLTASA